MRFGRLAILPAIFLALTPALADPAGTDGATGGGKEPFGAPGSAVGISGTSVEDASKAAAASGAADTSTSAGHGAPESAAKGDLSTPAKTARRHGAGDSMPSNDKGGSSR